MEQTTLGALIAKLETYDEYRPIFIDARKRITRTSRCLIVLGDDPAFGDVTYVPQEAKDQNMTRFLSSGQIMDAEIALSMRDEAYSEDQLLRVLAAVYAAEYAPTPKHPVQSFLATLKHMATRKRAPQAGRP